MSSHALLHRSSAEDDVFHAFFDIVYCRAQGNVLFPVHLEYDTDVHRSKSMPDRRSTEKGSSPTRQSSVHCLRIFSETASAHIPDTHTRQLPTKSLLPSSGSRSLSSKYLPAGFLNNRPWNAIWTKISCQTTDMVAKG